MNIKKVMVQVAMAIQEKDADVYNMVRKIKLSLVVLCLTEYQL